MDLSEAIDQYIEENSLHRLEGRRGVENLAKVVNALGYEDFQHYGQLRNGASLGDIFEFLGDNPGCIEAMIEWIKQQRGDEWLEKVKEVIVTTPLASTEYKDCPDCGQEVDPEAHIGDACDNCGHVFNPVAPCDDASWNESEGQGA